MPSWLADTRRIRPACRTTTLLVDFLARCLIRSPRSAALQGVNSPGGTVKRRLFPLLAVPALAVGFVYASPGTEDAHAAY
jgi:hypothetical protein